MRRLGILVRLDANFTATNVALGEGKKGVWIWMMETCCGHQMGSQNKEGLVPNLQICNNGLLRFQSLPHF